MNPFSDLIFFHLIDSNYYVLMFDLNKEINLNLVFLSIHMTNVIILFHSSGKKNLQSYTYFENHIIHVLTVIIFHFNSTKYIEFQHSHYFTTPLVFLQMISIYIFTHWHASETS